MAAGTAALTSAFSGIAPYAVPISVLFIALMFVNYATTDPMFYGTNKADYGVSGDKEMQDTPLYRAVAVALRELEAQYAVQPGGPAVDARRP